jgi:NAD-dependent DNA ligase/DNA polymerase/3'-5' exonuclease PolX
MNDTSTLNNFIKLLNSLVTITKNQGEHFKSVAYTKAINELQKYLKSTQVSTEVLSYNDLKKLKLPNIGKTILEKYEEFLKTGTLEVVEREKTNPVNIFANIYGIGPIKAKELVTKKNIVTLEQLRAQQNNIQENKLPLLNTKQQIGLKYYEDLLKRIPRTEIEEFKELLTQNFSETLIENSETQENNSFEIVGSFRRNKSDSGDIDLIITSYNNNKSIFENFIKKLVAKHIVVELLSKGETKCLTIGKLLKDNAIPRRIDFLYALPQEYAFSILYFTGSKEFNTSMRQHALNVDLTLNEHGFHKMSTSNSQRSKEEKITKLFKSEKDIFDFLCMEYKEPHERIDGDSVVLTLPIDEIKTKILNYQEEPKLEEPKPEEPKPEEPKPEEPKPEEPKPEIQEPPENKTLIIEPQEQKKKKSETLKSQRTEPSQKPKVHTLKKHTKKITNDALQNIEKLKAQGITSLAILSIEELTHMLTEAINNYYTSEFKENTLLTDNEYDILREYILAKDPTNKVALEQHTQVKLDHTKVKLPYEMWSMDKIKPDTSALDKFKQTYKGPYVISAKLDGVSALYSTENDQSNLYTRGDGKYGQLINHLIPYLKLPTEKNITLRGELMIKEDLFKMKYKGQFSNSRNFISGLVNRKTLTHLEEQILEDIDFVTYEVLMPKNLTPSQQYNKAVELNTISVLNIQAIAYDELTNDYLSSKLLEYRTSYVYSIDGIICIDDNIYPRVSKNPDHAFAFKMVLTDQEIEAKVVDVLWTVSSNGLIKPRVQFEPVTIGGVSITYATGFNAKFIKDNNIGLGALVKLIRSGDVIPYIAEVLVPAQAPLMPNSTEYEYIWNATNIDIILVHNKTDPRVIEKTIIKFFKDLEVEGLGDKNVKKILASGANTIEKIINASIEDLMKVEGFKQKMASKIHSSIKTQVKKASIAQLASASNIFGQGFAEKTISTILEAYPNILTSDLTEEEKVAQIKAIKGFADKTARQFVKSIDQFNSFMEKIRPIQETELKTEETELKEKELKEVEESELKTEETIEESELKEEDQQSNSLKNKVLVLSDFDKSVYTKKEITNEVIKLGGRVEASVTKETNILVVGNILKQTTKIVKAKKNSAIEIIQLDSFLKKYLTHL